MRGYKRSCSGYSCCALVGAVSAYHLAYASPSVFPSRGYRSCNLRWYSGARLGCCSSHPSASRCNPSSKTSRGRCQRARIDSCGGYAWADTHRLRGGPKSLGRYRWRPFPHPRAPGRRLGSKRKDHRRRGAIPIQSGDGEWQACPGRDESATRHRLRLFSGSMKLAWR
jgi:hypothetical protein